MSLAANDLPPQPRLKSRHQIRLTAGQTQDGAFRSRFGSKKITALRQAASEMKSLIKLVLPRLMRQYPECYGLVGH
jgi:hypothetical protein